MSKKDIIKELIQQTLDAIQEENKIIWEHEDHIPQIELDLIMSNIRKLYENYILLNRLNQSKQIISLEEEPEPVDEVDSRQRNEVESASGGLTVDKEEVEEADSRQRNEVESASVGLTVDKEEVEEADSRQRNEVESASGGLTVDKEEESVVNEIGEEEEEELKPAMKFGIGFTRKVEEEDGEVNSKKLIVDKEEEVGKEEEESSGQRIEEEPVKDELPKPPVSSFDLFSEPGETVADKFTSDEKTVNDQLVTEENNTIADKIQQTPIEDLKSFIGINDRFIFMRDLFDGQLKDYSEAIDNLNDKSHLKEAIDYFNELKEKYKMDETTESYKKLYNYIQRKYA